MYNLVNAIRFEAYVEPMGRQFWSWGGLTEEIRNEIEDILK
jgi:hypothetical protein